MASASFQLRLISPILFCAICTSSHAQFAEWADQRSEEIRLERAIPVGGGRWAVIGTTAFGGSNMISVRNSDGAIDWEDVDQYFVGYGWGDVILLPDSGLLHVGATDGCDYTAPPSRVRRYSPEGTVLWERIIAPQMTGLVEMAAKSPTNLLAVASADSVYVLDLDGNIVDGYYAQPANIRKLHWQGDSALFVVAGSSIVRVRPDGALLNSSPVDPEVLDLHYDGQQVFVLANSGISRYTAELQLIGTTVLPSLDASSAFIVSEDGLFVNTTVGLLTVATDGITTQLFPWPQLPAHTTTGCGVRNGEALSVGNTSITSRSTGIIRRLSLNGEAEQHDEDVEVLLQVDSVWTEFIYGPYWRRKANITGQVVNHGNTTLDEVVLSMWIQVGWLLCTTPTNRIVATDLALAPGDTASLPFGVVDVADYMYASQAVGTGEICIVALAPNHLADRNPEDNTACVPATFVLGQEEALPFARLILAPNPATGTVMLSGSALTGRMVHVRLLDAVGRIVLDRNVAGSTEGLTIDVSGLPPAAYVVTTDAEGLHAMAQLIIVRP